MPTDFESLPKGQRAKYSYYNATGVYDGDSKGWLGICFAYKQNDCWNAATNPGHKVKESFILVPVMSEENTNKWLKLLQKGVKFKYEWVENFQEKNPYKRAGEKNKTVKAVRIWYPHPDNWASCMMFGNLCKGISEQAFFCEKHLEDTTPRLGFFTKNLKAFKETLPICGKQFQTDNDAWPTGHTWWLTKTNYTTLEKKDFKTKTLKELFHKALNDNPPIGYVWKTCLGL